MADFGGNGLGAKLPYGAFPDGCDSPFNRCQGSQRPTVAHPVVLEFSRPEIRATGGGCREPASLMMVPEAAVNEDRRTEPRQDNVRPSRQSAIMEAESKPGTMQCAPQGEFRLRVATSDSAHHSRAGFAIDNINHSSFSLANLLTPGMETACDG